VIGRQEYRRSAVHSRTLLTQIGLEAQATARVTAASWKSTMHPPTRPPSIVETHSRMPTSDGTRGLDLPCLQATNGARSRTWVGEQKVGSVGRDDATSALASSLPIFVFTQQVKRPTQYLVRNGQHALGRSTVGRRALGCNGRRQTDARSCCRAQSSGSLSTELDELRLHPRKGEGGFPRLKMAEARQAFSLRFCSPHGSQELHERQFAGRRPQPWMTMVLEPSAY
jgi:hypothetical protein